MFKSLKPKSVDEDDSSEEKEEVVEEVVESDDVQEEIIESVDNDNSDDDNDYDSLITELVPKMIDEGEGGVRDYLYSKGYEFDDVDKIIADVHKAVKSGTKVDGKGMYCSGGVKSISDDDTEFVDDFDEDSEEDEEEEGEKKKKKIAKKSEFDDPVEEVYSMLKEGDPIPLKLAENLLENPANLERLLQREGVKASKYQVFIERKDEIEEAAK